MRKFETPRGAKTGNLRHSQSSALLKVVFAFGPLIPIQEAFKNPPELWFPL